MKELKRSFGGKVKGFETKLEQQADKAHLTAYLKGQLWFYFKGKTYKVKEIWQ